MAQAGKGKRSFKQTDDREEGKGKEKGKTEKIVGQEIVFLSISKHFSELEDPRVDRTKRHLLMDIIGLTICAVIGGCNGWVEVELFGKSKYKFLKKYLNLPNGIPSHDTIGRVFAALNPQAFETCFISWTRTLAGDIKNIIAIDGKSVRGSGQNILGKKAIHMVSAFSCAHRLVLGQIKTDEKSNEITVKKK